MATDSRRSRNSYARSLRSVTESADRHALAQLEGRDGLARAPDARLLAGDRGELLLAASSIFESCLASPTPMLSVIFSIFGTCMIDE